MTTLLLARHAESDWNRERRWQGWADRALTERGRKQAAELAARLAKISLDGVYSSDLSRARDTASAVATQQGLPLVLDSDLREVDVGAWSGLTRADAEERFPEGVRRWRNGETGWTDAETYGEMSARVLAAVGRTAMTHPGGRILVVTHGGPIRAIHARALGVDLESYRRIRPVEPNARLSAVRIEDGRLTGLWPAARIDELLAQDEADPHLADAQSPTPAG